MGGRYFNFNCSFIDIMTPNKQPECVECTVHEMIREGSIHQIKAMNCRVKPLDPVFFDTTATEQPEWGKVAEKWLEKESVRVSVLTDLQTLIKEIVSSRDTYWKERVRKNLLKATSMISFTNEQEDILFEMLTNKDNLK